MATTGRPARRNPASLRPAAASAAGGAPAVITGPAGRNRRLRQWASSTTTRSRSVPRNRSRLVSERVPPSMYGVPSMATGWKYPGTAHEAATARPPERRDPRRGRTPPAFRRGADGTEPEGLRRPPGVQGIDAGGDGVGGDAARGKQGGHQGPERVGPDVGQPVHHTEEIGDRPHAQGVTRLGTGPVRPADGGQTSAFPRQGRSSLIRIRSPAGTPARSMAALMEPADVPTISRRSEGPNR